MTTTRSLTGAGILADGPRLLKAALRLDSAASGVNGLAYLALAGPLEDLLGLHPGPARAIGGFLVAYALAMWAVSMPARVRRGAATAVIETNVLWAVLSVLAVITGWLDLNAAGAVWAVLQAAVVAGFAALQYTGLRRSR
ncbi:hypothetical protein Acsp04_29990 [Actinomadura sp. NBRC 104425]|uniref:hypothetical protein n=1 Tax=Actinomadura sp. NBRC 104425 TaxID=3032204 RepID=UPI0024A1CD08|nr:hypothetical protein [Actinomadura sp. NBRC 104425]GLZ12764.1 hypothetical protein Acsp04_29990 [Actinomadura sp. NBRC 104425]